MPAHLRSFAWLPALAGMVVVAAGCSLARQDPATAVADHVRAKAGWVLALDGAGAPLAVEAMDIDVQPDATTPEPFDLHGDDVRLVGTIPAALRVRDGEGLGHLVGQTLVILPAGGDPDAPGASSVTIDGVASPVLGGTFTVAKLTGRWAGKEGDRTLHGTVELRLPGAGGERTVRGTLAAHAVTWG